MNKLLATTILATSLIATGAMAQTTPPPAATTAPAATTRLPLSPIASLEGLSANDVIGAAVRSHVADASRTVGSATAPRPAAPATAPAVTGGTGTAGSGTTIGTTGTGSTTGTTATGAMSPPPATGSTGAGTPGAAAPLPSAPATSAPATSTAAAPAVDTRGTDRIGKVSDIILGKSGVDQLIVSVGGVMGIGDKLHAIPMDKASFVRDGNDIVVMVSMSEAELKALPEYKKLAR